MTTKEEKSERHINLFENIALTFSGGGYRAGTFAIGILSYLNQVPFSDKETLLERVKGLSTVSGGTLTGASYAWHLTKKKEDFQTFYQNQYKIYTEDRLLTVALDNLANNKLWEKSHKKRSLINAFALAYETLLTNGTFADLEYPGSHLEDIIFNASEFSFGLAFRFQTTGKFGNYRLNNPDLQKLSSEIRIADAIASSSCFPSGFEPMIMPDDYFSDQTTADYLSLKNSQNFKNGVGIMDGGIIDNQGIGSIMNANIRRKKEDKAYDLFMVCDVGSYFMDPWKESKLPPLKKIYAKTPKQLYDLLLGLNKYAVLFWLPPLLISIALLTAGFMLKQGTFFFIGGGALLMLTLFGIGFLVLVGKTDKCIHNLWSRLKLKIPGFLKGKLVVFENLKLALIQRMIEERVTSSLKMITNIFLKQIRRLNYNLFYKDESLKNRRITALIYELTKAQYVDGSSDEKDKETEIPEIPTPTPEIMKAALCASNMGTTLWFTEKDREEKRLENLIACGQFTACYNLLKYCVDLEKSDVKFKHHKSKERKELKEMKEIFLADWEKFRLDAFWLHKHLLRMQ
jgi:predicted acylesterase/phospholipase RssA